MRKYFLVLIIIIILTNVNEVILSNTEDLVVNLPDYNYSKSKLYSGYLSIPSSSKQLHYIFVESQDKPVKDPVILWLNGGPGCSSLLGFSDEHGPMTFKEHSHEFKANEHSWNQKANMLYLESPAGVGFSTFYNHEDLDSDDNKSGMDNLQAVIQFFKRFPEFSRNDFYVSGESYAGIYVPYLVTNILDFNRSSPDFIINIKGMMIGNGVTDWSIDTNTAFLEMAFTHGLYSYETKAIIDSACSINSQSFECKEALSDVRSALQGINIYDLYRPCKRSGVSHNYTPWLNKNPNLFGQQHTLKETPPCIDLEAGIKYFNREDVKRALHVDINIKWEPCSHKVNLHYFPDFQKGSFYLYKNLIKANIKILIYSGDTDGAVPFNGTQKWIKNLQLDIIKPWKSWRVSSKNLAGYITEYKGLTFVTIKGTGHMAPQWKRKEAYHMIDCFINNKKF